MKYFRFCYSQNGNIINENIAKINDYCLFLAKMYEYYFKPVKTGNISCLDVIFFEDKIEKLEHTGTLRTIYIKYDHKILMNKSAEEMHKILLEEIQKNIINYILENNWNKEYFEKSYKKIVENKYLFEENYMEPLFNKNYKAQITFKHDYQNSGVFLEIYKNNKIDQRIQFLTYGLFALNIKSMEWIDENRIKIIYWKHYWEININGIVEFKNNDENNSQELYDIGKIYYEGSRGIMQNKEKGIELIKKSANMGYKHSINWLKNNSII